MAYKYTISRRYILDTAKRLSDDGVKVHKGLRNLDVRSIRDNFNDLVNLARDDWTEQTGESSLPDEQYNLLKQSFAETLVNAENLKPLSDRDWTNILIKSAESYDTATAKSNLKKLNESTIKNIIDSDIYFDIINSIASRASNKNVKRFMAIKYTYAQEGTGDLNNDKFRELLGEDDYFALGRLAEVYKDNKGFTSDDLYIQIKERAINKGIDKVYNQKINVVDEEPIGPSFNFDF